MKNKYEDIIWIIVRNYKLYVVRLKLKEFLNCCYNFIHFIKLQNKAGECNAAWQIIASLQFFVPCALIETSCFLMIKCSLWTLTSDPVIYSACLSFCLLSSSLLHGLLLQNVNVCAVILLLLPLYSILFPLKFKKLI